MTDFTHLHCHSEYSLLDGLSSPEEIAQIASSNGQYAAAITDHGAMGGIYRFREACVSQNVKPIFGVEAYFVDDVLEDVEDKRERFHLIVLAKSDKGLKNLFKITRQAWGQNFYYKPRIDFPLLEAHGQDLVVLSGCMGSAISQAILNEKFDRAEQLTERFQGTFGDDFYMEIQPWNPTELNDKLLELGDAKGIKTVGTADCHYPRKEDKGYEDVLLAIAQSPSMNAEQKRHGKEHAHEARGCENLIDRMNMLFPDRFLTFQDIDVYLMDNQEIANSFKTAGYDRSDILDNTMEIAEKCTADLPAFSMRLPKYSKTLDSNYYLRQLAEGYLDDMGLLVKPEYKARLDEELALIEEKNFPDYFLILWDIVSWARKNDIAIGPSRGSAGGVLLAYALGITKIDPLEHDLLFERFMDPSRADFPDIDMDFEDRARGKVKDYMKEHWGGEFVAGVTTYGLFQAKAALKSVASVFHVPYQEANAMTSLVDSLEEYFDSKRTKDFRTEWPGVGPVAKRLEGTIRTAGAHAGGMVISSEPLHEVLPIETRKNPAGGDRVEVTALDKDEVEKLGLIKFDILGVSAVSVIKDTLAKIKERHGLDVEAESLDYHNAPQEIWDTFNDGHTAGVFQADASAYRNLIQEMGVHSFNDLVVSNALVRPGAFNTQGETYLEARRSGKISYVHPILEPILKETYGAIIYQEQLMKLVVELCGFTKTEANSFRKIIAKKQDGNEFAVYRDKFYLGVLDKLDKAEANELWETIVAAALYQFNKSHAVGYSLLSYQTMWLKINYPHEFTWALLVNEGDRQKITSFIFDALRQGISIDGPDINKSEESFTLSDDDVIRFGIHNVAGCGDSASKEIIKKRPYSSIEEFLEKTEKGKVRKNNVEALEKVGAFESLGHKPYDKYKYYAPVLDFPIFLADRTPMDQYFTPCGDIGEAVKSDSNFFLVRGVVKDQKRTANYYRIEIEDMSGSVTAFAAASDSLAKREAVVAVVGDGTLVYWDLYNEVISNPDSEFMRLVTAPDDYGEWDRIIGQRGVGKVLKSGEKMMVKIIAYHEFKTKNDSTMGNLFFVAPDRGVMKAVIFPDYPAVKRQAFKDAESMEPFVVIPQMTKRGGYKLSNSMSAREYAKLHNI